MHDFVEHSIRGGISQISKRKVTANNAELEDYDDNAKTAHLLYIDANNLYMGGQCLKRYPLVDLDGWMSQL